MVTVLNPKFFYRSTIKTMSLMLLASCAIHAADKIPMQDARSTQTTTTTQYNPEISDLEALPPEILREVVKHLDGISILALAQTSRSLEGKIAQWPPLSDEEKAQADAHIDKMFRDHYFADNAKSIAELIKDSFDLKDLTCRELYRSCGNMTELPCHSLIQLLIDALPNNPLNIFTLAIHQNTFFTFSMDRYEGSNIISALASLSVQQIIAIAIHASQFFPAGMNGYNRAAIISALARLSTEKIAAIAAAHTSQFFTAPMTGDDRAAIISALARLSTEKIQAICAHASQLLGDINGHDRVNIACAFSYLSAEKTQAICAHASQLLGDVDGYYRFKIIEALFPVSVERTIAITTHASQLFTEGMTGYNRSEIIKALARLSADKIAGIAGQFTPTMDYYERIKLINAAYY